MAPTWTEWLQERGRALPYEVNRPTQTHWSIRLPAADAVSLRVYERTHPPFSADAGKYGRWEAAVRHRRTGMRLGNDSHHNSYTNFPSAPDVRRRQG